MGRGLALRRPAVTLCVVAAITLLLDQVTKAVARASIPAAGIPLLPGVFDLTLVRNSGGAFGVMSGRQLLFIVTTVVVLGGVAAVWIRYRPRELYVATALGLVVGGALGNLVDRVLAGQVTDFLYVHLWPVFNVADSAVVVGVGVLVVWLLFKPDDDEDAAESGAAGES
jgi:signal peptidase II